MMPVVQSYFLRFGFCPRQLPDSPAPGLALCIVIPCHNEPDIIATLDSLWRCSRPKLPAEIIVVVNASADCSPEITLQNESTCRDALTWISSHQDPKLRFHVIDVPSLPPKHAGVGLARKIGMDEALRRFDAAGTPENRGVIACFDADCECDPNYLVALTHHFETNPNTPGCSIHFEHPLAGPLDPILYTAVAAYELHLRYYVEGLRFAGFPFAFHTVGSAMAVTAQAYRKQGGMNKRQAGEDFYFINKIIPLGNFTELNTTRVIPSPRPSTRVPFGTGKAVRAYMDSGTLTTYPLRAFQDLKHVVTWVRSIPANTAQSDLRPPDDLPPILAQYLNEIHFAKAWELIRSETASVDAFRRRFFLWFDAFRVMKYMHYARDNGYGTLPIAEAATALLPLSEPNTVPPPNPTLILPLLERYRALSLTRLNPVHRLHLSS